MSWLRIAADSSLPEKGTLKFSFHRDGLQIDGFVARFAGRVVGFENLCRHIPISIDYDDNRFFTPDHEHFICQTHGALYEPLTGKCVRGPCEGNSLYPLDIVVQKGVIWLRSTERQARDPAR